MEFKVGDLVMRRRRRSLRRRGPRPWPPRRSVGLITFIPESMGFSDMNLWVKVLWVKGDGVPRRHYTEYLTLVSRPAMGEYNAN